MAENDSEMKDRSASVSGHVQESQPFHWFDQPQTQPQVQHSWLPPVIGLLIGCLLFSFVSRTLGAVVCGIAATLLVIALFVRRLNTVIQIAFTKFGVLVGTVFTMCVLTPVYLVGFTLARVWARTAGEDPLELRDHNYPTNWKPCDIAHRKQKYARRMFATDARSWTTSGGGIRKLVTTSVVGLLLAEGALRLLGFGTPILYMNDPLVGFMPVPNQDVRRYGGRIQLNQFAQRSPDYSYQKPAGTLRVLLIGDSTLYGGSYIDQADLYSTLVEARLKQQIPDHDIQVMSMGVNDWGPFNKTGYIRRYGAFDADVAVICMPIIDVYRRLRHLEPGRSHFFLADRKPKFALGEILNFVKLRGRAKLNNWGYIDLPKSSIFTDEQKQKGIDEYRRLVEMLRSDGCQVCFEILPTRDMGMIDPATAKEPENIQQLRAAVSGVTHFGWCSGLFHDRGTVEEIYADEMHLAEAGHILYADYLSERLMKTFSGLPQDNGDAISKVEVKEPTPELTRDSS